MTANPPTLRFWIPGVPAPGGSKTATVIRRKGGEIVMKNGRPLVTTRDDAKGNAAWKQNVAFFGRQAHEGDPLTGPLAMTFSFVVTRPKGHYGSGRNAGSVRTSAPPYPTVKPDVTKLIRSTEDALRGIVFVDDNQVVKQYAEKRYGNQPGCSVTVYRLDGAEAESMATEAITAGLFAEVGA